MGSALAGPIGSTLVALLGGSAALVLFRSMLLVSPGQVQGKSSGMETGASGNSEGVRSPAQSVGR